MTRPTDAYALVSAALAVRAKDAAPFRQLIFDDILTHKRSWKAVSIAYERLSPSWVKSILLQAYAWSVGAKLGRAPDIGNSAPRAWLSSTSYPNERRQIEFLRGYWPTPIVDFVRKPSTLPLHLLDRRVRRIAGLLARRTPLLAAARTMATIAFYLRFRRELLRLDGPSRRWLGVVVSSDSNPEALGVAAAFRRSGLRAVYVNHGFIPEGPPRLSFDLSILDGPALAGTYRSSGQFPVVYKGIEGQGRAFRRVPSDRPWTIGVFTSLIGDWTVTAEWLARLARSSQVASIRVRLHPNLQVRHPASGSLGRFDKVSIDPPGMPIAEASARCDLVIAGNSSVHLNVLKSGAPTVFVDELDRVPREFYSFQSEKLVYEARSIEDLDAARINAHYDTPEWRAKFLRYDPYAAVEDPDRFAEAFGRELRLGLAAIEARAMGAMP